MEYKQIQSLIKDFEKSSLSILELEFDGVKIKLAKPLDPIVTSAAPQQPNSPQAVEMPTHPMVTDKHTHSQPIKSPLVGTFYASGVPGNPPFVCVGQPIKKGQVIGIIEAMKIMNEITSPFDGVIKSIEAKSGDAIGYDQVLMVVSTGQ